MCGLVATVSFDGMPADPALLKRTSDVLTHRGPDHGARRAVRLFAGTGFLGGYTTYSAFALDVDGLIASSDVGAAVLYGLATVVVGAAAGFGGLALGFMLPRRRGAA